jgi:hypothetical protein
MAWFRVKNKTELPVHVSISQAGIIYFHKNDLAPGGYWESNVGLGGYDLNVIPSNGSNKIDPSRDNVAAIGKWALGAGAVVVGVAGLALVPFSGGGSLALVGAAAAGAGAITTVSDITVSFVDAKLHPKTVEGLYGPDGYNFEIVGGQVLGHMEGENNYVVDSVLPFTVHHHNNNTGKGNFNGQL